MYCRLVTKIEIETAAGQIEKRTGAMIGEAGTGTGAAEVEAGVGVPITGGVNS